MIAWLKERLARANRMPLDPAGREAERRACRTHDEAQAREFAKLRRAAALEEMARADADILDVGMGEDVARVRGER